MIFPIKGPVERLTTISLLLTFDDNVSKWRCSWPLHCLRLSVPQPKVRTISIFTWFTLNDSLSLQPFWIATLATPRMMPVALITLPRRWIVAMLLLTYLQIASGAWLFTPKKETKSWYSEGVPSITSASGKWRIRGSLGVPKCTPMQCVTSVLETSVTRRSCCNHTTQWLYSQ